MWKARRDHPVWRPNLVALERSSMEGPLGVGMPRTEGDTQEVDFFSPQALLESYRAMSEDSVHSAQEAAHRPCSTSPNVVVTSTLGGAAPSMLPAGTGGDMQVENVSASESVLTSYRAPSAEQTRWAFVGAGS